MLVKLVIVTFICLYISENVDGKAVGRKEKSILYPGSSYSLIKQASTQWIDQEQYNSYATSKNDQRYYGLSAQLSEYAEESNLNQYSGTNYDLKNYDNLELMLDSEFVPQDLQTPRQKFHQEKLVPDTQESKETGPLESDQVFLHHEDKMSNYSNHKVKHILPESNLSVHSKGNEKRKPSVTTIYPEVNTAFHKASLQPPVNRTQLPTATEQLNARHLSPNLTFTSIPSELIHDSSVSLELNQTNLSEDLSVSLNLSEDIDLKSEDMRTLVSSNIASNMQGNGLTDIHFGKVRNTEDEQLFKTGIGQMFETNFDSFLFNPSAQPLEKFQNCKTPGNESGFCRYVQHCMLPSILNSIQHFMENVCIIQGRFIGVCCPDFPVQSVLVKWEDQLEDFNERNDSIGIPQDCGIGTNTRIVGGNNADRKAWPWMVALLNSKKKFFCGGSLINNQYVLTAAHCTFGTPKNQIVARLGEYDFNNARDPHDDYPVVEIKRHGQYNSMNLRNDIALLKLQKPVVFNEFVKTICLPEDSNDFIGNMTTLVGWGHLNGGSGGTSDVLQEASFPVISNSQCSETHGIPIPSSLICAGAVARDKGACNGDSGGPLMLLDKNNRWKVIGLVSWGRRGCNPKFPTVYTRVTHFINWIRKHSV